jgi:hypothetical protein
LRLPSDLVVYSLRVHRRRVRQCSAGGERRRGGCSSLRRAPLPASVRCLSRVQGMIPLFSLSVFVGAARATQARAPSLTTHTE